MSSISHPILLTHPTSLVQNHSSEVLDQKLTGSESIPIISHQNLLMNFLCTANFSIHRPSSNLCYPTYLIQTLSSLRPNTTSVPHSSSLSRTSFMEHPSSTVPHQSSFLFSTLFHPTHKTGFHCLILLIQLKSRF
jgi:hypothetical protein